MHCQHKVSLLFYVFKNKNDSVVDILSISYRFVYSLKHSYTENRRAHVIELVIFNRTVLSKF